MKTSKRLLSLLLALTMVLSLMGNLSVAAFAEEEATPTVVTTDGNDQPTTPVTPDEEQTTPVGEENVGETPAAPANGGANTEPVPTEGGETPTLAVPTRKADYPAESSDTVMTGKAYLLSDLQTGKIFDGEGLTYQNYYYERSTDGGKTWSDKLGFSEAIFGGTIIQLTEKAEGTYIYRFYASFDGENFSTDIWTLTLTVEDKPVMDFSFFVGKDYTGGYPVIKLYNVTTAEDGSEVLGDELENVFLYSNFTNTPDEGEEKYDVAGGKLVNNYQMFYAKLAAGRYAYRAFTADGKALGGMTLDLPTDTNVDGGKGGGTSIYLQCNSFYVSTKKSDGIYFTADEYHIRVNCPIMKCDAAVGEAYVDGDYTYYPAMLYAAGNACLYNYYAYPDIKGYAFSQNSNQTFIPGSAAGIRSLTLRPGVTLTVIVPKDATFGLYYQWNNFNTTEVEPTKAWADCEDGKNKTADYVVSTGADNGNYTWRLSDGGVHKSRAGWFNKPVNTDRTMSFTFDRMTTKFGAQVASRDEADLQVNLDPSGYEAITGTTRVRAYRHWQLINSDAGNIMVEPDFHWNVLSGDATYTAVNGGNANANWADITPGAQDSIIAVYYDALDVSYVVPMGDTNRNYSPSTHGGPFPATNPERVGVMVVGGTGVTHGTADAKVKFNMAPGATTTRSMDWDYNYDTWYYGDKETNPALDFTVNATGSVKVEYALAATDSSMTTTVSGFKAVFADKDGNYAVPLSAFNTLGNGKGGTVIIKMTDSTGVSYRLVRVAKSTITVENLSNPGEAIMPGDEVKVTVKGLYRGVNKISGIFNPTNFKPTYWADGDKFECTLGQYQKMDNMSSITVTVPKDLTFEEGKETAEFTVTNGYTYGQMYAAANPFAFLYGMTDTGVGTNFNAVTVDYYMNHYADVAITVNRKAEFNVKLNITDESGNAVDAVNIILTDRNGNVVTANEDGTFTLTYGPYSYTLVKDGFARTMGSFSLSSADAASVKDGKLTIDVVMTALGENAWDGTTVTVPAKDENGVYQIGTAAELAWFAQAVNGGQTAINAKLTADIELASKPWTPIGTSSKQYKGTFDGNGKLVKNLYIDSTADYQALFGYLGSGVKVRNLGVTGSVTTTGNCAAGIGGYLENTGVVENCYNAVNVTAAKTASGIANGRSGEAKINNSYNVGTIIATGASGLAGGITSGTSNDFAAQPIGCYAVGKVSATKDYGVVSSGKLSLCSPVNCYYLDSISKDATNKKGTAVSLADMKTRIEANASHPFNAEMLKALAALEQEADKAAAAAVIKMIDAIGKVELTADCKAKIDAARAAYDALTEAQQKLVSNYDVLTAAETKYAADKAAVDDVISKIDAIGEVKQTKSSAAKIDAARAAYDALDDELKAQVTNYETLTAAEQRYQQLLKKNNSGSSSTGSSTNGKTDSETDGKTVKSGNTADNSQLTLWLGGVVVSAAALALLARKRRQDA